MLTIFFIALVIAVAAFLVGGVKELLPALLAFSVVTVMVLGMGWVH